jgi:hypothetical protein
VFFYGLINLAKALTAAADCTIAHTRERNRIGKCFVYAEAIR